MRSPHCPLTGPLWTVSWLGATGHCALIACATACWTALEIEAKRACMLTAMRGCSVEASACSLAPGPGQVTISSVTRARFAELVFVFETFT